MERDPPYVRISELLDLARLGPYRPAAKCDDILSLVEETFFAVEAMSNEEREDLMTRLAAWILVEKFDAKGQSMLLGLQRYCMAECLLANSHWQPPPGIPDKLLPREC